MRIKTKNNGSVLIVVIFARAALTAFAAGMFPYAARIDKSGINE
jgi:hypothetical protein